MQKDKNILTTVQSELNSENLKNRQSVASQHANYINEKLRNEKRSSLILAIISTFISLAIVSSIFISTDKTVLGKAIYAIFSENIPLLSLIVSISAASGLILKYLQPNKNNIRYKDIADIENRMEYIDKKIENNIFKLNNSEITKKDKEQILKSIQTKIESEGCESYLEEMKKLLTTRSKNELIGRCHRQTSTRLDQEVQNLTKRGNLNLLLGIITTIFGLSFLAFTAITMPEIHDLPNFSIFYIPRISFVILIEIFAYFFLKLYRNNLYEIKYFQNEMTNIELKYLASLISIQTEDIKSINSIAIKYAETERNFILNNGQTTVEIEKEKLNQQNENKLFRIFTKKRK